MLRTVFLDMDDTLLDFHGSERAALTAALTEAGIPAHTTVLERYHEINRRCWERLEEGELTREQVMTTRFLLLFDELGVEQNPLNICKRYEFYLSQQSLLIPGATELLKTLSQFYALYIATNGTSSIQRKRIANAGIDRYVQGVFISEEVGFHKPSPEFFRACFAAVPDFHPEEAVIIGDSLTSDIRGGKSVGLCTCWYNPTGRQSGIDIYPDYIVSALEELPPLLATL